MEGVRDHFSVSVFSIVSAGCLCLAVAAIVQIPPERHLDLLEGSWAQKRHCPICPGLLILRLHTGTFAVQYT